MALAAQDARRAGGTIRLGSHLKRSEQAIQAVTVAIEEPVKDQGLLGQSPFPRLQADSFVYSGIPLVCDKKSLRTRKGVPVVSTTPEGRFPNARTSEEVKDRMMIVGIARTDDATSSGISGPGFQAAVIAGRSSVVNTGPDTIEAGKEIRVTVASFDHPAYFKADQSRTVEMTPGAKRCVAGSIPNTTPWYIVEQVPDSEYLTADNVAKALESSDVSKFGAAMQEYLTLKREEAIDHMLQFSALMGPAGVVGPRQAPLDAFHQRMAEYAAAPEANRDKIRTQILNEAARYVPGGSAPAPLWRQIMERMAGCRSYTQGLSVVVKDKIKKQSAFRLLRHATVLRKLRRGIIGKALNTAPPFGIVEFTANMGT